MSAKSFIASLLCLFTLVQYGIADNQDSIKLHYNFQKGKSYHYSFVDNTKTKRRGGIPFEKIIIGVSSTDASFTIGIYPSVSSALSAQFANMIFTKYYIIDKYGKILDTRISKKFKVPDLHEDLKCSYFISQAEHVVSGRNTYAPPLLLPAKTLKKDEKVVRANKQFIFQGMSDENHDIAKIKVFSHNEQTTHYKILSFDVKRNLLLEELITGKGSTESFVTQLKSIEDIPQPKLSSLINDFKNAITEKEFCLLALRPFLNFKSKNKQTQRQIKRIAFATLMDSMKNQKVLCALFKNDILKASIDNPRFCSELVDPYLYDLAMSGKEWAFDELISPERNAKLKATYSKCIIPIDGFDRFDDRYKFEKDSKKWKRWYERIHKVLPKMKSSSNEELIASLKNKDSWVRLFALPILRNRYYLKKSDFDLEKLSTFLNDDNKKVSAYVLDRLQTLSGQTFEKNSKKWKEWFKRVQKVFPELESTKTEDLKAASDNKDPWVRLFALNTLNGRLVLKDRSTLVKILEKASHDKDKQVSEYAKEQLDNLKE